MRFVSGGAIVYQNYQDIIRAMVFGTPLYPGVLYNMNRTFKFENVPLVWDTNLGGFKGPGTLFPQSG
jgi:hypothetical protein